MRSAPGLPTLTGFHSAIISHIPSYQDMLMAWLSEAGFGDKYWGSMATEEQWNGWSKIYHFTADVMTMIQARIIPSSKAFLFILKPSTSKKLESATREETPGIRSDKRKGPCWGGAGDELCFERPTSHNGNK
ncbi:hypothetical protein OS493_033028 [Desmophyllum pertusum]|uniref:Uncharacterized protein n=1 Tax=Desmophyllum pertusum TaxID=174260 RepID=A0A9W9ZJ73_9CNID|nr:hypothetical protein OS493_033028 [Desmophyllum pertusum]